MIMKRIMIVLLSMLFILDLVVVYFRGPFYIFFAINVCLTAVIHSSQNDPIAGLDRVDDPGRDVVVVGGGGAGDVVRQPEAASGADQLELGLGRVGQRREVGEPPRGGDRRRRRRKQNSQKVGARGARIKVWYS